LAPAPNEIANMCASRCDCKREIMSDLNRGIMKFDGADKPVVVAISALVVLGGIAGLIVGFLCMLVLKEPKGSFSEFHEGEEEVTAQGDVVAEHLPH